MEQLLIVLFLFLIIFPLYTKSRKPAVNGKWYSADPEKLHNEIKNYMDSAKLQEKHSQLDPLGVIVPHAGYMFSAGVAAHSYQVLTEKPIDTVIVLGSSHHYLRNIVSVYAGNHLQTPLGDLKIDKPIVEQLLNSSKDIVFSEQLHAVEHSNEAQFPFIKYVLPQAQVVSILTSTSLEYILETTAESLANIIKNTDKRIVLICSTDMSHFHSYKEANQIDQHTIDLILMEKWKELHDEILITHKCELCGYSALQIFINVMQKLGSDKPVLLNYLNSGDVHPEYGLDEVVGYGSILFPARKKK